MGLNNAGEGEESVDKCGRIKVRVEPEYLEEHSDPQSGHFVFAYHIFICNMGPMAARLMGRHWYITDGDGKVEEVEGDGVIGEQPLIAPGQTHRYSSFCIISTPVGAMEGYYRMKAVDGREFDADIPAFRLTAPGVLH